MKLLLGRLYTKIVEDRDIGEGGFFSLDVECERNMFFAAGDKAGFVKRQFAIHLAHAMSDTQVPIEYWRADITANIARDCNLPTQLSFGVRQ